MAKTIHIPVKETHSELKEYQKKYPQKWGCIQMLVLMKEGEITTVAALSTSLSISPSAVQRWRSIYRNEGIQSLLEENRGGNKPAKITDVIKPHVIKRLNSPTDGFKSYKELCEWLNKEFGIGIQYQAARKYVREHYQTKLKVPRKSHIHKSSAAIADFKKTRSATKTY